MFKLKKLFEVISPKDLVFITGLSKTSIWRLERAGQFPPRIQLSPRRVGYRREEVEQWLSSRSTVNAQGGAR